MIYKYFLTVLTWWCSQSHEIPNLIKQLEIKLKSLGYKKKYWYLHFNDLKL